jgi:hypothetical protein
MKALAAALVAGLTSLIVVGAAFAQTPMKGGPTPSPPGAEVYFIDLKDGATVPPKFTVHFGLRGMGVAPAGSSKPNTGHHHLLIDTELPPLDQPIPSDFNHLHFGAGQTEADLTLSPGPHTLQLLLGDGGHIPHTPPVYSQAIHINVVEAAPAAAAAAAPAAPAAAAAPPAPAAHEMSMGSGRHPSPPGAKVFILSPTDGAVVPLTLTVRFGIAGMTIVRAGVDAPNSGHHHLLIDAPLPPFDEPIPSDENHLHFGAGQTEATITLTPGRHTLQLLLGDGEHMPHDPPVFSTPITVVAQQAPRRSACRAGESLNSEGLCERHEAAQEIRRPAVHRRAAPERAVRRGRPTERRYAPSAAEPVAQQSSPGFVDRWSCQAGQHAISFPSGAGYKCISNQ